LEDFPWFSHVCIFPLNMAEDGGYCHIWDYLGGWTSRNGMMDPEIEVTVWRFSWFSWGILSWSIMSSTVAPCLLSGTATSIITEIANLDDGTI
jgi:hypothetical protein